MSQKTDDSSSIADSPSKPSTFAELGLAPELLRAIEDSGYTNPTPIQERAVPIILAGKDLMGGSQTGTGKTAAFVLPMLQRILPHANTSPSPARHPVRALILTPTRELALQVHESAATYAKHLPLRLFCAYGGVDIKPQMSALQKGVEILVATPGRLLDHIEQKSVRLSEVQVLVLDEADRMLDMGFIPDITRIINLLPKTRQSLLFSATFSEAIKELAGSILSQPELIEVAQRNTISETINHKVYTVPALSKRRLLTQLLKSGQIEQCIVFVKTKLGCSRLARELQHSGIAADTIHGDKNQLDRLKALNQFKEGKSTVLVGTDVAARGLDIEELPHVINYELPHTPEDYIHRIGRTGRAGKQGNAISLVSEDELPLLAEIEKLIKIKIPRSSGPHLESVTPPNSSRKTGQHRTPQTRKPAQNIDSDGFDFNKPYEPCNTPKADIPGSPSIKPRRSKHAISALLGGVTKK